MSEETNEPTVDRYVLESTGGMLHILDLAGEAPVVVETYVSPEPALARLAVLNRRAAAGMAWPEVEPLSPDTTSWTPDTVTWTPAEFLHKALPDFARRQRLEALLAESRQVERDAMAMIKAGAEVLTRAVSVGERLERHLKALNASESAEIVSRVPAEGSGDSEGSAAVSCTCSAGLYWPHPRDASCRRYP